MAKRLLLCPSSIQYDFFKKCKNCNNNNDGAILVGFGYGEYESNRVITSQFL